MHRFVILGHVGNGARHLQRLLQSRQDVAMPADPALFSLLRHDLEEARRALANPIGHLHRVMAELRRHDPTAAGFTLHYSDGVDSIHDAAAISDSVSYALDQELPIRQGKLVQAVKRQGGMQAASSRFFALWRHLHEDPGLHIVHLRRSNRIAAFLDVLAASRNPPHGRHHVEPVFFHDFDRELQGHARYISQQFGSQPRFEVYYEDLVPGGEVVEKLAAFLKLPGFDWQPDPEPGPHPRTWLTNFTQWQEAMRETPWQSQMEAIANTNAP